MYCNLHRECSKSGDNGNCTIFNGATRLVNKTFVCGFVFVPEKTNGEKKRVGQQKQKSKK